MKLLFVHGGVKVKEDRKGNLYIDGAYSKEVLQRYLSLTDELTVIFRKDKKIYEEEYAKKNFEILDTGNINFVEYIDRYSNINSFLNLKNIRINKKTIEKQVKDNDKIIVRLPCMAGYETAKYAKKYDKPYMSECVGCIWDALWNYGIKGKILAVVNYIKMRRTVKNSSYVTYVTDKFLQNRYPNNNRTISCSDVNISRLNNEILQQRITKIKTMKEEKTLIVATLGAIDVKYKGQEYVIKAMNKLKEKGYNIKYYIIGAGDKTYLEKVSKKYNLKENIIFTGAIPHNEIFKYLDFIDLYIQPSKLEGLPRALIEAMSRACPCIASNVGENKELINYEYIFKKKNVKELVTVIENISIKQNLIRTANENFIKAQYFEESKLEEKRSDFYLSYIEN